MERMLDLFFLCELTSSVYFNKRTMNNSRIHPSFYILTFQVDDFNNLADKQGLVSHFDEVTKKCGIYRLPYRELRL